MTKKTDNLLKKPPNLNMLWGALLVEELVRNGVNDFFISPGSRSTPVTWAVANNPSAKSVVHYDERAAAYCALGVAKSTGWPTAVVCTSGTAAANFFPAIVEASKSFIPLILITADRPDELLDAGANQTIDQINMFGKYPRWFINLPCPNPQMPGQTVLTAVDQAVYRACNAPAGPVHINMMFREPLAPTSTSEPVREVIAPLADWDSSGLPYTNYDLAQRSPTPEAIDQLVEIIQHADRPLLLAGQAESQQDAACVLELARALNWPLFPDITSGLRLGPDCPPLVHYYDQLLFSESFRDFCRPDLVIQTGAPYVSKRLERHLAAFLPARYVIVANHPHRHDPTHIATSRFEAAVDTFTQALTAALNDTCKLPDNSEWLNQMLRWNAACRKALDHILGDGERQGLPSVAASAAKEGSAGVPPADCGAGGGVAGGGVALPRDRGSLAGSGPLVNCGAGVPPAHLCEPAVAHILPSLVPHDATMFLASSMPIRDADMYALPMQEPIFTTANRGASGVDGLVATAAGYAHGSGKPVVLVLGDLAMLHDLNSLALLSKVQTPVIVIAINNFGGGIFSFLPIAAFPEHFEKFWAAPHAYTFKHAAEMFNVPYTNPATLPEFTDALKTAIQSNAPALIEIHTNRDQNVKIHRAIQEHIRKNLDASGASPS